MADERDERDETEPADESAEAGGDSASTDAESLRREAAKWRREARAAQKIADEQRAQLERERVERESDQERRDREIREDERAKVTAEFAGERLHSRLRVRAAGKLRDADDAVLHLGGVLDADADNAAIDEAIDELIKQRDYLAAPAPNGPTGGLVTQGARSAAPGAAANSHRTTGFVAARTVTNRAGV